MENPQEILDKRSAPGLLLFDLQGHLLFFTPKTREFIPSIRKIYSRSSKKDPLWPPALSELLHEVIDHAGRPEKSKSNKQCFQNFFCESEIPYSLRAFLIGPKGKKKKSSHILILIEPIIIQNRRLDMGNLKTKFNLSKREMDVVKLICAGFSNKKIAGKLFIGEYTVKDHLKHIMEKLGANSRNQIITTLLNLSDSSYV